MQSKGRPVVSLTYWILVDENLKGGHDVDVHSIAPPAMRIPLRAEVFRETSSSDKIIVPTFDAPYGSPSQIVKFNNLCTTPACS
jgi:hypothetical protein